MIGLLIGIVSGVFQFWLLSKFTKGLTTGKVDIRTALFGLVQFLLPIGILAGTAFLRRQDLLWTASGIVAALIIAAVFKYVVFARKTKGRGNNNE